MREIWSNHSRGSSPANCVTSTTAVGAKQFLSAHSVWLTSWLRGCCLCGEPAIEVGALLDHDVESHQRVRTSAVLCASAAKDSRSGGIEHESIDPARDHVHFAPERRNPEGVNDVRTVQSKLDRFTDRKPDFVRQHDFWSIRRHVTHAPPP